MFELKADFGATCQEAGELQGELLQTLGQQLLLFFLSFDDLDSKFRL